MSKQRLSDKYILIRKIQFTLILIVWWFICGCVAVFSLVSASVFGLFSVIAYLFLICFYLKASYNSSTYTITKDRIIINKGVLFSRKIEIFKNRILYTQLIQTPLQKLFHTCTLAYQTAGAVVYLYEIDLNQADGAMFNENNL